MDDPRQKKRFTEFFESCTMSDIKSKREGHMISLRKKQKSQIFMQKRSLLYKRMTEENKNYESLEKSDKSEHFFNQNDQIMHSILQDLLEKLEDLLGQEIGGIQGKLK